MKLPNAPQAIIDRRKLTDYALDTGHEDGKHKAALFRDLLGIMTQKVELLIDALRQAALQQEAQLGRTDRYGQRYVVDFAMTGPRGPIQVRSAWIVRTGENAPRLVTCYII